ncbi:MAG TPA: ROK family protein [Candidatus Omnitrophota bacterium]|nr:ROK family protein [Candidatus Omnitrophota bacterium]
MAIKIDGVFTYHITQDRERKNLAILEFIRKKGPVSRAEISRHLGINIVTISNYIDFYINKKIILEVGLDVSSGGRRPELIELNAKGGCVVGVCLGPEKISAIVADLKVKAIAKVSIERPAGKMEDLTPSVIGVIEEVIKKSALGSDKIKNIGIGISGIVDYPSGTIRDTDPARGRTRVSFLKFSKAIEEHFNMPVYIGNDASCAAFGEKTLNPAADVDNLVYFYSDVGSGIVTEGDVYIGSSGCAGEIQLAFNGFSDDERNNFKDCAYMKPFGVDLGVSEAARAAVANGANTEILKIAGGDPSRITKATVLEAVSKNDKLATEIITSAGTAFGIKISYLVNFLNPEIIIIGGGMERSGDAFMDAVRSSIKRFAFEEPAGAAKVIPSLLGEDSIVLGAAALSARELFIQA